MPTTRPKFLTVQRIALVLGLLAAHTAAFAIAKNHKKSQLTRKTNTGQATVVLWTDPGSVRQRDLFFGPGGKQDSPHTSFTFVKEDPKGLTPKFDVRDSNGVRWKVKLGVEAQPETAATRLVWAMGYRADEDYFLEQVRVENLPQRLHRGQKWIRPGGVVLHARLERHWRDEKRIGRWDWARNPFAGTRALNGLKVLMALINNWDSKDDNNAIYDGGTAGEPRLVYLVSDLGASFGSGGRFTLGPSKGNLGAYRRSKFIRRVDGQYVDFDVPAVPPPFVFFNLPEWILRREMISVCTHIPRADARWMGQQLAQLSPEQIRAAFRAAGYSPREVEGFTEVVEARIAELNRL